MIDVEFRPAQQSDAAALAQLRTVIYERARHGRAVTEADVTREFTTSRPPKAFLLAESAQGLVGWALCAENESGGTRRALHGGVHPDHRGRGIGRRLLTWQLDQLRPGDEPVTGAPADDGATRALLERFGFQPRRQFIMMSRLTDPATTAPNTDLTVTAYRPEDDHQLWLAHQESFAEHYGFEPSPEEVWLDRFPRDPQFRPELSFVAFDGTQLVGFALTYGTSPVIIQQVGTRAAWRGRGAAGALLGAVVDAARATGVPELQLFVDAENSTGAASVYERAGFVERMRRIQYGRWR
jgi:mycothiol synthase